MSWEQDLANLIWNSLWGAISSPFAALSDQLLQWSVSAVQTTPSLSNPAVATVWSITYAVFLGALGISIAGIGLMYILSPLAEKKFQLKQLWIKLGYALILGSSTMLIGNFCISVSNELATAVLSQGNFNVFSTGGWSNWFSGSGPLAVVLYLISIILLVTLLIEQGVRILMVFFTGAILPWAFLLWSFPTTQAFGTKIIKMFFEWTFVNVFIGIVLVLGSLFINGNGTSNGALNIALVLGSFALAAAMPKVMTESGSAVSSVGQAVLGGVLGASSMGGGSGLPGVDGPGGAISGAAGAAKGPAGVLGKIGQAARLVAAGHGAAGMGAIGAISLFHAGKWAARPLVRRGQAGLRSHRLQKMGVPKVTAKAVGSGKIDLNDRSKSGFALPHGGWYGADSAYIREMRRKASA
ncbi:MAG: hypothetical protein KGI98_08640 [Euryarchaeota archaeon]|nr:hypothetical protein [Euryarchaeota archaeon]